jgi:hypothetical protein
LVNREFGIEGFKSGTGRNTTEDALSLTQKQQRIMQNDLREPHDDQKEKEIPVKLSASPLSP